MYFLVVSRIDVLINRLRLSKVIFEQERSIDIKAQCCSQRGDTRNTFPLTNERESTNCSKTTFPIHTGNYLNMPLING